MTGTAIGRLACIADDGRGVTGARQYIVEAILDGKQGPAVTLAQMLERFPMEWMHQANSIGCGPGYAG